MKLTSLLAGAALGLAARALFPRLLLAKFSGDVAKLNAGDHSALLDAYADDFVLHFNDGPHRWAGDWVGRAGMDRFLQTFTAAGIQGEIRGIATSGPLWALTMWVRFDDHAVRARRHPDLRELHGPRPPDPLGQGRRAARLLRRYRPHHRLRPQAHRARRRSRRTGGLTPTARTRRMKVALPAHSGEVAQLVEHTTENRGVAGSIPALATTTTTATSSPRSRRSR